MKNFYSHGFLPKPGMRTLKKKMIMAGLILFLSLLNFQVQAGIFSGKYVTLKLHDATLFEMFESIESQTGVGFLYKESKIFESKKVTLKIIHQPLGKVLNEVLPKMGIDYEIENSVIILKPRETKNASQQPVAQAKYKVSGKITDNKGEPLPGASVVEVGTSNGTITDKDGKFSLEVSSPNAVLKISFIGFQSKTIQVNNRKEITIVLSESVKKLETVQIVSTGYQKLTRVKSTAAAVNISSKEYENSNNPTLLTNLQGSVAGLQVLNDNSHPLATPEVIIRGVGSAFQKGVGYVGLGQPTSVLGKPLVSVPGSPLYVIDGVPTTDGYDLSTLNPDDIKSISVLKDAAATSIYGSRGANGVIVIETKSGRIGRPVVTFSTQMSGSQFTKIAKSLNTPQLEELYVEGLINNTTNGIDTKEEALNFLKNPGPYYTPFNPDQNTNWEDVLTRQTLLQQYNLSLSGSKGVNRYYFSLGYLNNKTGIKEINFDRFSMRVRYDTRVIDKIKITTDIGYSRTKSDNYETGASFYNPFWSMYTLRPDFKVYNDDGSYDLSYNYGINPLGILKEETRLLTTNSFRSAFNLNYNILPHLVFEAMYSGNYNMNVNYNNFPSYIGKGLNNGHSGIGIQKNTNIYIWDAKALLRYRWNINQANSINAFAGTEYSATDARITNVSVDQLRDGAITLDNGKTVYTYTKRNETAFRSLFINADYSYKEKYIFNASFRRDGSSKFGPNNRFGNFYAFGAAWNISNEAFMDGVDAVDFLKLRTSYGVNGNDQIGDYNYVGTFNGTAFYNDLNATTIASAGNALLGWERNASLNIGVDFSLFDNRLSGHVDYYSRNTSRLLFNLPISAFNGDSYVFQNFGGMHNGGIEVAINSKNIISANNGFRWNTSITFTSNKNKVTQLKTDDIVSSIYHRQVGKDFYTLYLYGYAGVDPATGEELYYKDATETETTTNYREAVKYDHGKTSPDFYGSFGNTFYYKNFSLNALFYTSWGGQIFDLLGMYQNDNGYLAMRSYGNTSKYVYDHRWQKPGDVTDVPKYVFRNRRSVSQSSRWLHDGSFIRLKKVELAYTFPKNILGKTFIRTFRVYVGGDNLWTYVKDKTLLNDPEIGGLSGNASFNAPPSKTFYFGLNMSF